MSRRWEKVRKTLVRAMVPLLRAISPRGASRTLATLGRIEHALTPGSRSRHDGVARRWAHHFGCKWDAAQVGKALAGNEIRWLVRDQVLDGLTLERLDSLVRVIGRQHLDSALGEGLGVVLLGNHFGSHMVPSHWLLRHGYQLRLYMERPHHVSRLLSRHFASDGPLGQSKLLISRKSNTAESAGSIFRAVKVLKAGMILCLAGDVRWSGPNTAEAQFLGETHSFTATWVALAAITGAPVVPIFCRMNPDGSYELEFHPSFRVPSDAIASRQAPALVQGCLVEIEDQLRRDPSNGNEYVSWFQPDASRDAVTLRA